MVRFMSDRRVLASSAAVITVAIMAFLIVTFPHWRAAVTAEPPASSLAPAGSTTPSAGTADTPQHSSAMTGDTSQKSSTGVASTSGTAPQPSSGAATDPGVEGAPSTPAAADAASSGKVTGPATGSAGADDAKPSFDIVRVEPTGDAVVAARAKPGDEIVLLDQGQPIARAKADGTGQVAFVPPPLTPGDHSLMLSVGDPKGPGALSSQSVAVSVPAQPKAPPLVALIAPGQPTKVLSGDGAGNAPGSAGGAPPAVAVSTIDVEDLGSVFATGRAPPDSRCRVYLNGSFIAAVTAGRDGAWSLRIEHGMRPGRYTVRIDQMEAGSGQVKARAEVPFDYPARIAGASPLLRPKAGPSAAGSQTAAATPTPPSSGIAVTPGTKGATRETAPADGGLASAGRVETSPVRLAASEPSGVVGDTPSAVVAQLLTTKVVHGDSLWRISRKMLGHGVRYTQIYAANTTQIRDPKLIYPGQIFVMPQNTP